MRKYFTYLVIAASLVYYAALPFVVAQAGGNPGLDTTNTASTAASAADAIPAIPTPLYMRVTAYASVPDETSDHPFIMADGNHVYNGAAASNLFPFGTKIEIPALFGGKIFTVEDRMSPRIKNTVDLWMPSVAKAVYFGVSHTNIVIISEPSSTKAVAFAGTGAAD
jgi:3D (Asp-Asp-Asp) domain-containing protein